MSAATEIAEREALDAEAEYPDPEQEEEGENDPEPEPEPEPEPHEPPSDVQAEATIAKIDREAARYGKAIAKIIEGSLIAPDQCPCCVFPGLVFGYNPHSPDDQMRKAAVDAYFGEGRPKLNRASDTARCEACDGWGDVDTDSRKELFKEKPCVMCQGQGWITKATATSLYAVAEPQPYPGSEVNYSPVPSGMPDAWNRPAGHPHWGMEPSTVGA